MTKEKIKTITLKIIISLHFLFDKYYGLTINPFFLESLFTKTFSLFILNFNKILENISFLPPKINNTKSCINFSNCNLHSEIKYYLNNLNTFLKLEEFDYNYVLSYLEYIYQNILTVYDTYSNNKKLLKINTYTNENLYCIMTAPIYLPDNEPIYEEII